jgi:hypothetical protein
MLSVGLMVELELTQVREREKILNSLIRDVEIEMLKVGLSSYFTGEYSELMATYMEERASNLDRKEQLIEALWRRQPKAC